MISATAAHRAAHSNRETTFGRFWVMTVNGFSLRKVDPDFIGGGHHLVYPYIPSYHIWLDLAVKKEIHFLFVHEAVELMHMLINGSKYDNAHRVANRIELWVRQGGNPTQAFYAFLREHIPAEKIDKQKIADSFTEAFERLKEISKIPTKAKLS